MQNSGFPRKPDRSRHACQVQVCPQASPRGCRRQGRKSPPAKVVKIGKRLESVAREIKDADDFVEQCRRLLAKRYRREHALRVGDAQAELRQSLRTFH